MSVRKFQLPVSGFKGGLNTQASVLNILPSEMADGSVNVELLHNGSVRRRKGIDFIGQSDSGNYLHTVRNSTVSSETKREAPSAIYVRLTAPNGDTVERIVVDLDNEFKIFKVTHNDFKNFDTPYQTLTRTGLSSQKFGYMDWAVSGNKLYFAGQYTQPGYLQVASDNISLEVVHYDVIIRDPSVTSENTDVAVGDAWYECIEDHTSSTSNDKPGSGTNWRRYWFQKAGKAPSGTTAWANSTAYTTNIIKQYDKNTTPTTGDLFPTTVAFYAGRVWLAGDPRNPNDVYFTQTIAKDNDIGLCLQDADPFNADDPNLVDDDGGVISIQGSGLVKQLLSVRNAVFVGTTSSIWQVSGPNGIFKATDFSVNQILEDGIGGPRNMVHIDEEALIFGQDSVWKSSTVTSLSSTEVGQANFENISEHTIQDYYSNIPEGNKDGAVAVYEPSTQRVYYFHNKARTDYDLSYDPDHQPGYFRNALVFDVRFESEVEFDTGALEQINRRRTVEGSVVLYEWEDGASDEKPYIAIPFVSKDVPTADKQVTVGADIVYTGVKNVVTPGDATSTKALLAIVMRRERSGNNVDIYASSATFSTSVLQDWSSDATYAVSYNSEIYTGVQTMGNVQVKKVAPYIFFVFKTVESGILDDDGNDITPGGCKLITAWQWSNNSNHPKYSSEKDIYIPTRFNYSVAGSGGDNETHKYIKHRVRGRGNALQIILKNDADKDFHLVGWSQQVFGKST